jgi:hypothetical protein
VSARASGEWPESAVYTKAGREKVYRISLAERVQLLARKKICAQPTNIFPHKCIPALCFFVTAGEKFFVTLQTSHKI